MVNFKYGPIELEFAETNLTTILFSTDGFKGAEKSADKIAIPDWPQ
jgi:hypothetical protein